MSKRHRKALLISSGAVNPIGIANAIVEACRECLDEKVAQRDDAAVKLMVHQLAFIMGTAEMDKSLTLYGQLTDICKARENEEAGQV